MVRNAMHTVTDRPSPTQPGGRVVLPECNATRAPYAYPNCAGVWTISYLIPSRSLKKSA